MTEPRGGRPDRRANVDRLLAHATFEVIPFKGTFDKAMLFPQGSRISVTASPAKGMDATIDLAVALHEAGYEAVPHLSARLTKDRAELTDILARLKSAGIERAFVVGGDAGDPGEFFDAMALLEAMAELGHHFTELGVTGYPEGHPLIGDEALMEALLAKRPYAHYVATQMCFDVDAIRNWLRTIRNAGVSVPVVIGIPGVTDPTKLMGIAARIGVGTSIRYLAKNRRVVARLLRPGRYRPDSLVRKLGDLAGNDEFGVRGLHVFTFNQIEPTRDWFLEFQRRRRA